MSTGMSVSMATMRMGMRKNKHRKPMMNQHRMWWTEGIVGDVNGYECEHGDNADVDEEDKHRKPMMDQCRMWSTEGILGNVDGYGCKLGDDAGADDEE